MSDTSNSSPTRPVVVTTRSELAAALAAARHGGARIGLVPTMGALHAGHASLVDASRAECQFNVVTIFVNPTQFGRGEDFDKYPRTLEADLDLLAAHGANLVYAPAVSDVYRNEHATTIDVGPLAQPLEGAFRPDHFRGVATVVLKLFHLVPADVAYFGAKDYQQTLVVKQMAADLDVPTEIRVCPTVREADGLAMSSRNAYLSSDERRRALSLSQGLKLAVELVAGGERSAAAIRRRVTSHLESAGRAEVDYVAIVEDGTVQSVDQIAGPARMLIAARIGSTRLIDNGLVNP